MLDTGLTPPKMGMRHADFAERLLDGLQGAAGTEADAFGVTELHDGKSALTLTLTLTPTPTRHTNPGRMVP